MVGQLAKQRLGFRVPPSQGVKADALKAEIYLATHQSVDPMWVDLAGVSEQVDAAGIVAASQEDHRAFERRIEVKFESFGKRPASRGTVSSQGGLGPMRGDIALRDLDQAYDIGAMVPLPDFALPKTIESFDGVLEARLARWGKYRDHLQCQTKAANPAYCIGKLMGSLENRIVVGLIRKSSG